MKNKSLLTLLVTILVTAALLFGVSAGLSGIRRANAEKAHLETMQTLLPDSTTFTVEPYTGDDANIRSVHKGETGFVIETVTQGYAGEITMLIGVSNDGKVTGLVIRDMHETYDLGWKALNDVDFLVQYLNTSGDAAAALDALPEAILFTMELNSQVVTVNTTPPSSASLQASIMVTSPAARGSRAKVMTENTGMQI